ncbi:ATP-binding protein [Methanolobus bombayensis]|uniref:ATP-binding protein n=1 Tax=Methanolobus bombayensis TaxID=38023 RepID=UPI001AE566FF|nr:ATP-binding protein [Methanolobus bombayensis]MBP1909408.1 signal transduction histidine kinase [Methanolobus bombayensis]
MFRNHQVLAPDCIREEVEQVLNANVLFKGIKYSFFDYLEDFGDFESIFEVSRGIITSGNNILLICNNPCPEFEIPDEYSQSLKIRRVNHLYSLFTEELVLEKHRKNDAFFVSPGWFECWEKNLISTGLYESGKGDQFLESYSHVLVMDTGLHPNLLAHADEFSRVTGIPYKVIYVGMDYFKLSFENLLFKWNIKKKHDELKVCKRQSATYAMSLDFIKSLADMNDEAATIEAICNLFSMMFAPRYVVYYSVNGESMEFAYCKPTNTEQKAIFKLKDSDSSHFVFEKGDGFAIKIQMSGDLLGIIEIREIALPENMDEYLSIAYDIAKAASLAISNIRRYYELFESKEEQAKLAELLRTTNSILRHDIANNLQVITMALDLLEEKGDSSYISMIRNATKKSALLITSVKGLDMNSSGRCDLEVVNVKQVLESSMNRHDVEFTMEGNCNVMADQALLSVFDNIVSNAISHGKATEVKIKVAKLNGRCQISIADNGKGIPDSVKPYIFNEGFIHGEAGNTGIGLFVSKKTIERYNGCIRVEDNVPSGARFIVELDLVNPKGSSGN